MSQLVKNDHDELLWTRADRNIYKRERDQAIRDLDDALQGKEGLVLKRQIALNRDMRVEILEWKDEVDKLRNQLDERYKVRRGFKAQSQECGVGSDGCEGTETEGVAAGIAGSRGRGPRD